MSCERSPNGDHDVVFGIFTGERCCRYCGLTPDGIANKLTRERLDAIASAVADLIEAMAALTAKVYADEDAS